MMADVRIGVTGHRTLANAPLIEKGVRDALGRLESELSGSPHVFVVVSPLAEGADRLVAEAVLGYDKSRLEAVLPLSVDDYMLDFPTQASEDEFKRYLTKASSIKVMESSSSREEAYERAGRYVVDHCDVLIAIWDGKPASGRGGTAEIVEYAVKEKRRAILIDPLTGEAR